MVTSGDEIDNTSLENGFVVFALAVLNQIAGWAVSEGIQSVRYRQTVFNDTSSWTPKIVEQPNYQHLVRLHQDALQSLEEARQCVYEHWQTGVLKPFQVSDGEETSLSPALANQLFWTLLSPVMEVLQRYNTFSPVREHLLESYWRYREAWAATTFRADTTIPLFNFRAELQDTPLNISKNYRVVPFPPAEKTAIWVLVDSFQSWELLPFLPFLATEFKLEGSRSYPRLQSGNRQQDGKAFARSHQEMLFEIRNIVTALRLLKAGDVSVTAYIEQSTENLLHGGYPTMGNPGVFMPDFQMRRHGSLYILHETEVPTVKRLVEELHKLDARQHRGGLEVALRRFNQSYSRDSFEDRIIDLTISLESCLLSAIKSKTELNYRFALRGAILLARTRNAQEAEKLLSALYSARSSIVHEGRYLSELKVKELVGYQPREFVLMCEDIVRDILREYIHALSRAGIQSSVADINTRLEQQILMGDTSLADSHNA